MRNRLITTPNKIQLPPAFTQWHLTAFPNPLTHKELSDALTLYFSMECCEETRRELSLLIEREIVNGNTPKQLLPDLQEFVWSEGSRLQDSTTARARVGFETIH